MRQLHKRTSRGLGYGYKVGGEGELSEGGGEIGLCHMVVSPREVTKMSSGSGEIV